MAKILVIEDETFLREDIQEMLTMEGFQVITASDGVEGVNSALRHQPDLIICDIMMPRLDGYEVLQDVRANSLTQFVPFIFLTARAARDDLRTGMDLGADDYVIKPFERLNLLRAIETRLAKKAAQDEELQTQLTEFKAVLAHERGRRVLTERLVTMFSDDFRNPVSSILTSAGFLRDYADRMDEERRLAHVNGIEATARYLLDMLDDMLIVGQLESGRFRFSKEPLDLSAFFGNIVSNLQAINRETHPIFYESRFSGVVTADGRLLRQIAVNLIAYAVKSSPPNGEVHVKLENLDGEFALTIQDANTNVSEEDEARLFAVLQDGFGRNDSDDSEFGLTIVRQAVELHAGSVQIESQAGEGTAITVMIPIW